MKTISVLLIIILFSINANSQITKHNWLVGGDANVSSAQYGGNLIGWEDVLTIGIQPKVAYFFIDKFATGLLFNYSFFKSKIPTGYSSVTTFGTGPFIRYYFLKTENQANILAEADYQYGFVKNNTGYGIRDSYNINSFSFSAGPVIYFNTTVGVEFTVGYLIKKYIGREDHMKSLLVGIGLQVHLEKE